MTTRSSTLPCSAPPRRVLCAPYHLYTHQDVLASLFREMRGRGWQVSVLLPFTANSTLQRMFDEARLLVEPQDIHDFTFRRLLGGGSNIALARALRALALTWYFVRAIWLLLSRRPDALLLTSDLGGVSVRFVQLVARGLGVPIVTLQSTLFLRVAEREDLKFEIRPRWLHQLLSSGPLKKLFLYFGEIPGSFLPDSYVAVQDEEIRQVCVDFGKDPSRIATFGSLQAAQIHGLRRRLGTVDGRPCVLLLTECIEERFDEAMVRRDLDWLQALAEAVHHRADIRVRFHPRESATYRQRLLERLGPLATVDSAPDAVTAAAGADVIVGAFSMLMFDAQAAGVPAVFLDMGVDPIGFYAERRHPRAGSSEDLVRHVESALDVGRIDSAATAMDAETWARRVVDWIAGLTVAGHRQA